MPQKGHTTAGVAVLFDRAPDLDDIADQLRDFEVVGRADRVDPEAWMFGGPSVAIAYRPEVNGLVVVDVVDAPWPDPMGDPKTDPKLFAAWMLGHFGPFTFPDALSRASSQAWVWPDGKTVPERQKAFIRIRAGYSFGGSADETPELPAGYDARAELRFVTNVALAVLKTRGAIGYFNPNGEVLRDAATLADALKYADAENAPPLDAWCNVRAAGVGPDWVVMDTVGNEQIGVPDIELCIPKAGGFDLSQVDGFLRNVTEYLLDMGEVIGDGDTMEGLGVAWKFHHRKGALLLPPRRTLRAFPQTGVEPPAILLQDRPEEV